MKGRGEVRWGKRKHEPERRSSQVLKLSVCRKAACVFGEFFQSPSCDLDLLALAPEKGSRFGAAQKGADTAFGRHNLTTTHTRAPPPLDLLLLPHLDPEQGAADPGWPPSSRPITLTLQAMEGDQECVDVSADQNAHNEFDGFGGSEVFV